jgi:hypothetical protein
MIYMIISEILWDNTWYEIKGDTMIWDDILLLHELKSFELWDINEMRWDEMRWCDDMRLYEMIWNNMSIRYMRLWGYEILCEDPNYAKEEKSYTLSSMRWQFAIQNIWRFWKIVQKSRILLWTVVISRENWTSIHLPRSVDCKYYSFSLFIN